MQTMYDSLMDELRIAGKPLETIYTALTDLMAFDLHNAWNATEKAVRLENIRAALAARMNDVQRLAKAVAELLGKPEAQLAAVITPLLSDRIDGEGQPVKITPVQRKNRPPVVWSRHTV
jgi:hypothetical protein